MKHLNLTILAVFVFSVMISTAFANPIKTLREAAEEITGVVGRRGEGLTKRKLWELNRNIRLLIKKKPVSDIIEDLSDESVSQEDVVAGLYSYAKRRMDDPDSEMSEQELDNALEVTTAVELLEEGQTKQQKIGGFEFGMTDIISAFSRRSVFFDDDTVSGVVGMEMEMEMTARYIAGNLSDFTENGAQTLVRLFDHSRSFRFYGFQVFEAIEMNHLIGNHELLLRFFQLEYRRDDLARFILSGNGDFKETVIIAGRGHSGFSKYVDSVLNQSDVVGKIQAMEPEDIPHHFGQREIEEQLTDTAMSAFSRRHMGGFLEWQLEMFSDKQVFNLSGDQVKGLKVTEIPERWLRESLLNVGDFSPGQVDELIEHDVVEEIIEQSSRDALMNIKGLGPETKEVIEARWARSDEEARDFYEARRARATRDELNIINTVDDMEADGYEF